MTYSADLIESYATLRCATRWRGKTHEHAYYDPPANGIHLCAPDMNDAAATAQRYPMQPSLARKLFAQAKSVAECENAASDFVVDLCIDGEIPEDFSSNRQLWPLAIAEWNKQEPSL